MRATVSSASDVNVDVQGAPVATFSRKNLMKVIRDAAEFVYAPESGRPALGRVWVERENGIWSFFASDAHQIVRLNVPVEADDFQKHVCFLPTSLLAFLKKTSFEQVTWHETEDRIVLKAGRDVFVFYQTDAGIKPPPFHNVLPASDAPKCKVSVEKLDAAIRVALTFSRKKAGYPVRLTACDDTLIVFAQDKDKGDAEVNVPIVSSDWNFPDQTIHVNGQYLRKALRMARSKSMVTLSKQPNSIIIALTLNSPDLLYCVAEMVKDD
jgi:DNA polymerase III sliding clamp (beta) subunit (PCNA family)